ncbi:MAG: dihydrodipicolinate synthase family protein [Acidobacteriia bacterium]|jgi:4-hydroxy-2-oxoglutarate aldolase|nr:dihydrodipicolinate synthase family protein [Terriglobia bacterium]
MKLHGIFPPLTTPFDAAGELALDRLRANIERYNRTRLTGYVVIGSTGESVLLSASETERVLATAREAAAPDKLLIAGTGAESTAETIARTRRAAELGYQVALVKTPYYYKPAMTDAALAEHFLRVAEASPIPVLIYSVPQFTGLAVEAPLVARLAEHPNIIGIKESSGNVQRVTQIIHATPPTFQTLVGSAQTLLASISVGAVGGILALACVLPELCVELYEAAVAGALERARQLQHRLLEPALTLVGRLSIPGIKCAMDRVGYYGGPPRRPLLPLDPAQQLEVERVLEAVGVPAAR